MENGYGCKVTVVPSSTIPAVTSIAETGKPDIATELWVNRAISTKAQKHVWTYQLCSCRGSPAWTFFDLKRMAFF
jgi:hypothetical protein